MNLKWLKLVKVVFWFCVVGCVSDILLAAALYTSLPGVVGYFLTSAVVFAAGAGANLAAWRAAETDLARLEADATRRAAVRALRS